MYARKLTLQLHQNQTGEFTRVIESEIIPLLRKQPGFRDGLVLINPSASQAETISLWNSAENAEAFGRGPYSDMLKILRRLTKDQPQFQGFEVANTTLQRQGGGGSTT
ncbi:MAG: hypothetical protein WBL63_25205 [Candidatus Acidiferrum sp.]